MPGFTGKGTDLGSLAHKSAPQKGVTIMEEVWVLMETEPKLAYSSLKF